MAISRHRGTIGDPRFSRDCSLSTGLGASDKPAGHDIYSTRNQSKRIVELLNHLSIAKAIFVAHDLGGPWVYEIADHEPERISGLVILNTSADAELMRPPLQARMVGGPLGPMMMKMMRLPRSLRHF